MKNKPLLIGIIVAIAAGAYLLYRQYQKLMDFELSFRSIRLDKVTAQEIKMKLGLNFLNKSDIQVVLTKQKYDVFINDTFVATIISDKQTLIAPNSNNPLTFDFSIGSKGIADLLKKMSLTELLSLKKQKMRLNSTFDVKIGNKSKEFKTSSEDIIENWMKSE